MSNMERLILRVVRWVVRKWLPGFHVAKNPTRGPRSMHKFKAPVAAQDDMASFLAATSVENLRREAGE